MTEQTNAELIAEARRLEGDYGDSYEVMLHMSAVTDALEAADQRAEKRRYGEFKASVGEYQKVIDELAAVVEKVRAAIDGPHPANSGLDSYTLAHLSPLLDAAPGVPCASTTRH